MVALFGTLFDLNRSDPDAPSMVDAAVRFTGLLTPPPLGIAHGNPAQAVLRPLHRVPTTCHVQVLTSLLSIFSKLHDWQRAQQLHLWAVDSGVPLDAYFYCTLMTAYTISGHAAYPNVSG